MLNFAANIRFFYEKSKKKQKKFGFYKKNYYLCARF